MPRVVRQTRTNAVSESAGSGGVDRCSFVMRRLEGWCRNWRFGSGRPMPIDYQTVACVLPVASGLVKTTKVRALVDQVNSVAPTDTRVLVIGASGCGTKLVARSIHPHNRRTDHRYIAINGRAIAGLPAAVWVQAVPAAPSVPDPAVPEVPAGAWGFAVRSRLEPANRATDAATLERFAGDKRRTAQALRCNRQAQYDPLRSYNRKPVMSQK